VEPLLDANKPPVIAKMGFARFSLGGTPPRVEGWRLAPRGDGQQARARARAHGLPAVFL